MIELNDDMLLFSLCVFAFILLQHNLWMQQCSAADCPIITWSRVCIFKCVATKKVVPSQVSSPCKLISTPHKGSGRHGKWENPTQESTAIVRKFM